MKVEPTEKEKATVEKILDRLELYMETNQEYIEDWAYENHYPGGWDPKLDRESFHSDILNRLKKGWTANQIYRFLTWTEEVDPSISEDTALRNMARITKEVEENK